MLKKMYDWMVDFAFSQYMKNRPIIGIESRVLPNNERVEYVKFRGNPSDVLAQYIYRRIIVLEYLFLNYSENTQNIIIAHELGHKKIPWFAALPLQVIVVFMALVTLLFPLAIAASAFFFFRSNPLTLSTFSMFIFSASIIEIIFLSLSTIPSWILEGQAELFAINVVGLEAYNLYLEERHQKRHIREKSIFEAIQCNVFYPPTFLVLLVHSKLTKRK